MVQENEHLRNNNNNNNHRAKTTRSSNDKQKKVPQRGLGVAQLERIRIDEQRNREALQAANVLAKNAIQNPPPFIRPNSVPLPPPSSDTLNQNSVQINPAGRDHIVDWPNNRLWNGQLNHGEGDHRQKIDHLVFGFGRQVNLPHESNSSALPLRSLHQFQPPSSMVNASSGISPSSMEPPSNQSSRGNSYTSSWPEEDKMVGLKRSYPFSLQSPQGHSFNYNFSSRSRSDDLANTEPRSKYIRDGPSNSSPLPERNPIEVIRDNDELNGEDLKLAPPIASSTPSNSKDKQNLNYSINNGTELSEFKCFHSQENIKSQSFWWGACGSREQQPYSFFPDKPQTDQIMTAHVSNTDGEKAETIDLNLKL